VGQYKVPQNVESDDKILGPFTLKQAIYIAIGIMYGLLTFALLRALLPVWFIVGVPPMLVMVMLGAYKRSDQPFESYVVNIAGYFVKPRKRIWHKDPIVEAFHIEQTVVTAEQARRDPREVLGELEKLAQVVDTRGWSAKSAKIQEPTIVHPGASALDNDRIVQPSAPKVTDNDLSSDVHLADDILDFRNNPNAQNLNKLLADTMSHSHDEVMAKMQAAQSQPPTPPPPPVPPQPITIQPIAYPEAPPAPQPPPYVPVKTPEGAIPGAVTPPTPSNSQSTSGMTVNPLEGILRIAMENEDLTISQLSQQVQKQKPVLPEGETVELR
jgi:hypothetical protein